MIVVHHLENSRSQRILWMLEELELAYEVKRYNRDKTTILAPPELSKVHPSGKSPVIEDGRRTIAETGAIVEYINDVHASGRLTPSVGTDEYWRYKYWLHAAEGSYMPPLVLELMVGRIETAPMPFFAKPIAKRLAQGIRDGYLNHTVKALFDHLEADLEGRDWLTGDQLTAADILMIFPAEAAATRIAGALGYKNISAYVARIHDRPAYQRALERGGPYAYA